MVPLTNSSWVPFFSKSSCICGWAENRKSILPVQKDHVAFFRDFSFPSSLLCCRLFSQKQNHVINAVTGSVFVASPVEMIQQCGEELTGSSKNFRFSFKTCWERRKSSTEETFYFDLFLFIEMGDFSQKLNNADPKKYLYYCTSLSSKLGSTVPDH